jgi:hypothetical protein
LLDHELVEYLLALAIPRRDTKAQAKALIAQFGGVGPLLSADAETLKREGLTEGVVAALKIAEATALRLLETRVEGRHVLSSWDALQDYLKAAMAHSSVEEVRVLFLNAKNMLIANEAMWRGSVDEASMHVREVMTGHGAWGDRDHHSPQSPERRSDTESGRREADARAGRGRTPHEGGSARSCDRWAAGAIQPPGPGPDVTVRPA